jgi:hypothetical protein
MLLRWIHVRSLRRVHPSSEIDGDSRYRARLQLFRLDTTLTKDQATEYMTSPHPFPVRRLRRYSLEDMLGSVQSEPFDELIA